VLGCTLPYDRRFKFDVYVRAHKHYRI